MIKKPMLASACKDMSTLVYPLLASPKLDGIRCVTPEGHALSRSFKPIRNDYIREELQARQLSQDLDGELVTLDANGRVNDFNTIQGDVMRAAGKPDFQLLVFDSISHVGTDFQSRLNRAEAQVKRAASPFLVMVPHVMVRNLAELEEFEAYCVSEGYEGIMVRSPDGPYKQGRSTVKQQWLLKIKRFSDGEGVVAAFEEKMHNNNARSMNELGKMQRGFSRSGMEPADTCGALILNTDEWGPIKVGSGFTDALRKDIWLNRDQYLGATVTFRYQASGMKDKPRFPTFVGFRHKEDMS